MQCTSAGWQRGVCEGQLELAVGAALHMEIDGAMPKLARHVGRLRQRRNESLVPKCDIDIGHLVGVTNYIENPTWSKKKVFESYYSPAGNLGIIWTPKTLKNDPSGYPKVFCKEFLEMLISSK